MAERGLTVGERQMVTSIFGSSINLDAIKITDQPVFSLPFGIGQSVPMAPYGRIQWPADMPGFPQSDDFSTAVPGFWLAFFVYLGGQVLAFARPNRSNKLECCLLIGVHSIGMVWTYVLLTHKL